MTSGRQPARQYPPRRRKKDYREQEAAILDFANGGYQHSASAYLGSLSEPPRKNTDGILNAYNHGPWLRTVVHRIAVGMASTEWRVLARKSGGKYRDMSQLAFATRKERVRELLAIKKAGELVDVKAHPAMGILTQNTKFITGYALKELTSIYLDTVGEAFWAIQRNKAGAPMAAWPIPPHWVSFEPVPTEKAGEYLYQYRIRHAGYNETLEADDVIHWCIPDPANPYGRGIGQAHALVDEVDIDEYSAQHLKTFFYNRARPDVIISSDNLSPGQTKQLEDSWLSKSQGFFKSYLPFFLGRKIDVHQLTQSFDNMQLTELRRHTRDIFQQTYGLPPELIGNVESSNRSCYSEDTECLTSTGWKKHYELTYQDEIATWNHAAQSIEYHKPIQIVAYPFTGNLHHWKTRSVDVLVTDDHKMWAKTQFRGDFELRTSGDLASKKLQQTWRTTGGGACGSQLTVRIPKIPYIGRGKRGHAPEGGSYEIDAVTFGRFLGYWISEGSLADKHADRKTTHNSFAVRISQNVGKIADDMIATMGALGMGKVGVSYSHPGNSKRKHWHASVAISNKSLWYWLVTHVGTHSYNKRIPQEVFLWSQEAQMALLRGLMDGDGSKKTSRNKSTAEFSDQYYSTSSEQLADDFQRLCIHLGFRCSKTRRSAKPGQRTMFILQISSKTNVYVSTSYASRRKGVEPVFREVPYSGVVWCVEVPNHIFFTRRNGKVALHGNTIGSADYLFSRWTLLPRLEMWRSTLQAQLIPQYGDGLVIEYESPVNSDKEFHLRAAQVMPSALSVDEWRTLQGLPPLGTEHGSKHLVSTRLQLIDVQNGEKMPFNTGDGRGAPDMDPEVDDKPNDGSSPSE